MRLAMLGLVGLLLVGCQGREARVISECGDALHRHLGSSTFTDFTGTPEIIDSDRAVLHGHAVVTLSGSDTPERFGVLCTVNAYGAEASLVEP